MRIPRGDNLSNAQWTPTLWFSVPTPEHDAAAFSKARYTILSGKVMCGEVKS